MHPQANLQSFVPSSLFKAVVWSFIWQISCDSWNLEQKWVLKLALTSLSHSHFLSKSGQKNVFIIHTPSIHKKSINPKKKKKIWWINDIAYMMLMSTQIKNPSWIYLLLLRWISKIWFELWLQMRAAEYPRKDTSSFNTRNSCACILQKTCLQTCPHHFTNSVLAGGERYSSQFTHTSRLHHVPSYRNKMFLVSYFTSTYLSVMCKKKPCCNLISVFIYNATIWQYYTV